MKRNFIIVLLFGLIGAVGYAESINPASNALADSANTARTIVYRDASGNFSAGTITAAAISVTAPVSNAALVPAIQTLTAGQTILADACGGVKRINAATAVTTDTENTFQSPATAGKCVMDVINASTGTVNTAVVTLDINPNFNSAGGANVVLGSSDTVRVACDGERWFQIGATGNN